MRAIDFTQFDIDLAHCDWVSQQIDELKALFGYRSEKMLQMNKIRGISAIDTAMDSLRELRLRLTDESVV